jgi:hypothetical protein
MVAPADMVARVRAYHAKTAGKRQAALAEFAARCPDLSKRAQKTIKRAVEAPRVERKITCQRTNVYCTLRLVIYSLVDARIQQI